MKSAVNKISLGIFLSIAALSINVIPLFNDLIGVLLIMSGVKELRRENKVYCKAENVCRIMIVMSVIGYILNVLETSSLTSIFIINNAVYPSISVVIDTIFYYYLIHGFKQSNIGKDHDNWFKGFFILMGLRLIYFSFYININGTYIGKILSIVLLSAVIIIKVSFALKIKKDAGTVEIEEISNE